MERGMTEYSAVSIQDTTGRERNLAEFYAGPPREAKFTPSIGTMRLTKAGAAATAVLKFSKQLNIAALAYAVDRKCEEIRTGVNDAIRTWADANPDGRCYLPEACGALLLVRVKIAVRTDAKMLDGIFHVATGLRENAASVVRRFLAEPKSPAGVDPASYKIDDKLIWQDYAAA
jgi:hypothetical protein